MNKIETEYDRITRINQERKSWWMKNKAKGKKRANKKPNVTLTN